MEELDIKINGILRKLNPLETTEGFDRNKASQLVKYLEKEGLAELDYSNELKFNKIAESPNEVMLENLYIRAKITPKGKEYLIKHTFFGDKLLTNWKMYLGFTLPILLIGLFIKHYWNFDLTKVDVSSIDFTVFVHGPKGIDDLILKNQGKVAIMLNSDKKEATINEKGEATFKEIPSYFHNKKVRIFITHSQPYRPVKKDTFYVLKDKSSIYLEIRLFNTDLIYGNVIDSKTEYGVDSVRVSIRDQSVFTNKYGYFELAIPPKYQQKFQNVRFHKDGFIDLERKNVPVHTSQSLDVLIKRINAN